MRIEQRQKGDVEILELAGPLGGHEGGLDLRERFDVLLWEEDPAVIVDLSQLARIDSGFVGHLLECRVNVRARGGRLALVARNLPLEVLRLARLDELFEIHETAEGAMRSLSAQQR